MSSLTLFSRYKGAALGALFGDCLGEKFEDIWADKPFDMITKYFKKIKTEVKKDKTKNSFVLYTDDTCMTFDLGESLVQNEGFDGKDVAKNFSETFFQSTAQRNYGGNVRLIFRELKAMNYEGDIYHPAKQQFTGNGSYGNGSAMRVSPVALFYHNDIPNMVKVASDQSKLTHTNSKGVIGAILQSLAIEKAMNSCKIKDPVKFCQELWEQLKEVATDHDGLSIYEEKMENIIEFLRCSKIAKPSEVVTKIGSDVTAHRAVPAAIFSFLYTLDKKRISKLTKYNGFCRAVIFAVTYSADSDTVGSMTGAIAGAYYGAEEIPPRWVQACEGADRALKLAENLYAINQKASATS